MFANIVEYTTGLLEDILICEVSLAFNVLQSLTLDILEEAVAVQKLLQAKHNYSNEYLRLLIYH